MPPKLMIARAVENFVEVVPDAAGKRIVQCAFSETLLDGISGDVLDGVFPAYARTNDLVVVVILPSHTGPVFAEPQAGFVLESVPLRAWGSNALRLLG